MSNSFRNYTYLTIAMTLYSAAATADPGDIFQVTDFDFAMDCTQKPNIGDPKFPDSNVKNSSVIENNPFNDGEFFGVRPGPTPGNGDIKTEAYVSFDFFGGPVSNYTAARGVDLDPAEADHVAPTLDRTNLTANLGSFYAYWNGTEFNQGNANVTLIDNLDNTYKTNYVSLIVDGDFDGCTGGWKFVFFCTSCPPLQLGTSPTLSASQANSITRIITSNGGDVIITSPLGDTPSNYVWTASDNSIIDIDSSNSTYTFAPSSVAPGIYTIDMAYGINSTSPQTSGRSNITLQVVTSTTADMNDDNNNGIANVYDSPSLTSSQLMAEQGNSDTYILQTSSGKIKLGKTAFCANKAARITASDIVNFGSPVCGAVTNSSDDIIKETAIGGYFDFEIHDIVAGETVDIVLPLSTKIPVNATYRKYTENNGWSIFDITAENNADNISSSKSFSDGICPVPGSLAYTPGLTSGHSCVRLSITDGGLNDADGSANGVIVDPGGVAEIQSGVEAELSSGCSVSSKTKPINQHFEWIIIIAFIGWLSLKNRREQQ